MPTTRTPINHSWHARITPEITTLFERGLEILADNHADERWEPDGRHCEFVDISNRLHQLLGLKAWHPSPLDVYGEPPADEQHPEYWRQMVKLRAELLASTEGRWVEGD